MIRVLVAEDEMPILNSIKMGIEMTNPLFRVVATAYNGEEAVSLLRTVDIDVVFTDIRMPVMDGIGLIAHLKEAYPTIVPVIVSGYQEFEYAKKAMNMNVFDYLLKPLSLSELQKVLSNIADQIDSRNQAEMNRYMEEILTNEGGARRAPPPRLLEEGLYGVMLLCAGSFPSYSLEDYNPVTEQWSRFDLLGICGESLDDERNFWILDGKSDSEKVVIYRYVAEPLSHRLKACAEALLIRWATDIGTSITIGISSELTIGDVHANAQMLRARLYKIISIGVSQVFTLSQSVDAATDIPKLDTLTEKKLLLALQHNTFEPFLEVLRGLVEQWKSSKPRQYEVEKTLQQIAALCLRSLDTPSPYFSHPFESDIHQAVLYSGSYDQLYAYLSIVYKMAFAMKERTEDETDQSGQLMERLDEFLRKNLTEPINHQTLSEKFGLVPSYLSKLFVKYKGMSPAKYLVTLRMKHAKELMETQPKLLMKDIAALIGYQDPLYFSKLFKKETGVWPSEYKRVEADEYR
ncbi:response regulator [Cohnella sp. GCM10027633]|uniref:response regulator transcription factor n=1 Tax=unclassified Cohnella TaxID=2636738 RepID=UPI003638A3A9